MVLPGNRLVARLADELDTRPAALATVAGDDRDLRRTGTVRRRLATGRLHPCRSALHGDLRLLGPEHEHPGLGVHGNSIGRRRRPVPRRLGIPFTTGRGRHEAGVGRHADRAHVRLPDSHTGVVWLRPNRRDHRYRHLRLPSHGPQRHSRFAAGASRGGGVRRHVGN